MMVGPTNAGFNPDCSQPNSAYHPLLSHPASLREPPP